MPVACLETTAVRRMLLSHPFAELNGFANPRWLSPCMHALVQSTPPSDCQRSSFEGIDQNWSSVAVSMAVGCKISASGASLRASWASQGLGIGAFSSEDLFLLPSVMLIETSVFSTIFVNSSKLIFPSRSLSASMIVLSTI